jgi:septal ring factor EnvC (AmiA/AmiB activator)
MLHKETMKQDTTCPTCGLYWTREDNEDCPRCDTCNRLRIEQLEGQLSEAKAEIARLSADLEAANRERRDFEGGLREAAKELLSVRTQLEAANRERDEWKKSAELLRAHLDRRSSPDMEPK